MATESFFSNASLAYLASAGAGKDGKTYSIKPTDGTGDFTFSRGSNLTATRVGPTGLIEKGRENLLKQSNQFDTTWITASGSVTSGQSGYDGTSDAWLLSATAAYTRMTQPISTGGVNTFSVYAKANTTNFLLLRCNLGGNQYAIFDLSDGSNPTLYAGFISGNATSVGNGWYRISLLFNGSLSEVAIGVSTDGTIAGWDDTTNESIYIQDAQLEAGLVATDYIESGASTGKAGLLENEPRFDYSGGATCPSLLLEPQRVQLLPQTEYIEGYSNVGSTDEPNATTSPEGLTNATFLKEDTSTGIHHLNQTTTEAAGVYTASVFAKANGRDWVLFNIAAAANYSAYFNLSNGTTGTIQSNITSATIEDYGNGWYRCSITADTTTVPISPRIAIYLATGDNVASYTGDGTSGAYIYGFQLEAGSYPTSYIPNHSGGSATRTVDSNKALSQQALINSTEGTLFLDTTLDVIENSMFLAGIYGGGNELYFTTSGTNSFRMVHYYGSTQALITSGTFSAGRFKMLLTYQNNNWKFYINGVLRGTDTSGTFDGSGMNQIVTSYVVPSIYSPNQKVHQLLYFDQILSDADCISLTTL